MIHTAYLALGANLGNRRRALRTAAARVRQMPGTNVTAFSCLYETAPVGGPAGQRDYLNAMLKIATCQSPHALLGECLRIERELGRQRSVPNAPRVIDLDILLYDELFLDTDDLVIPHPRLHTRRFVLQPLADLAAGLSHPGLGLTIRELLDRLPDSDRAAVRRIENTGWAESH